MLNIYRASAGSGKTYRLTQDYIHLLFDPQRERVHRRIMAVTFTNKATDEMKTRILKELYALSQGEESNYRTGLMAEFHMDEEAINRKAKHILTTILHDYSSFSISTIDRFFNRLFAHLPAKLVCMAVTTSNWITKAPYNNRSIICFSICRKMKTNSCLTG